MDLTRILDTTNGDSLERAVANAIHTPDTMVVPVAMSGQQQELTQQVVSLHYSAILRYIAGAGRRRKRDDDGADGGVDDEAIDDDDDDLGTLRHDAERVAVHPYLVSGTTGQGQKPAEWSQAVLKASGKFMVLNEMITAMERSSRLWRVAVVAGEDTLALLTEALRGKCRLEGLVKSMVKRPVEDDFTITFYLVSSDHPSAGWMSQGSFDFTIVLEGRMDTVGLPRPVLRLITYNSIEHVMLNCTETDAARRIYHEVAGTVVLRDAAGVVPEGLDRMVIDWIDRGAVGELKWPPGVNMDLDPGVYGSPRLVEVSLMDSRPLKRQRIDPFEARPHRLAHSAEVYDYRRMMTMAQATIDELRNDLHQAVMAQTTASHELTSLTTKLERSDGDRTRLRNRLAEVERELFAVTSPAATATTTATATATATTTATTTTTTTPACGPACAAAKLLARAQESLATRSQENEYMRAEYQRASQRATDQAVEIKALQDQNRQLQVGAQAEATRLRLLTFDHERALLQAQIATLESRNAVLDEQVRRLLSKGNGARSERGVRQSARSASVK